MLRKDDKGKDAFYILAQFVSEHGLLGAFLVLVGEDGFSEASVYYNTKEEPSQLREAIFDKVAKYKIKAVK